MNIYEDEELDEKLQEITDQLGHLFLDISNSRCPVEASINRGSGIMVS